MTLATLKRKIAGVEQALAPREMAEYLSNEWWRVIDLDVAGKPVSSKMAELEKYERDRTARMSVEDNATYRETLWHLDFIEMSRRYLEDLIAGYIREEYLLKQNIELLEKERKHLYDTQKIPVEAKKTNLRILDERIEIFREYQERVQMEIEAILGASFWETNNIRRSVLIPPDLSSQGLGR